MRGKVPRQLKPSLPSLFTHFRSSFLIAFTANSLFINISNPIQSKLETMSFRKREPNNRANNKTPSLYPQVIDSNPEAPTYPQYSNSNSNTSSSNLYPTLDMHDLATNLFPEPSAPPEPLAVEENLIKIPGAILHLIDRSYSVELACGDLKIIRLVQGGNTVAVLASVADEIQWPLTKEEAVVKLDDSHYFFSFGFSDSDTGGDEGSKNKSKSESSHGKDSDVLNYGLTIASKGQEKLLKELEGILQAYSCFSVQKVSAKAKEALDGEVAKETAPSELKGKKKEKMEQQCAAYWTTLAPNVEDYSGTAAKLIAAGSGQLIRGILWCGDVTVDRLKWGNGVLKTRIGPGENAAEISPETLKRIKR